MEKMVYHLKFTRSLLLKMGDMKNEKADSILVQQMVCAGTENRKGGSGVRLHDGPDLKLFILVGWDRSFHLLLGPPGLN